MPTCQTAHSLQSSFKPNFLTFLWQRPLAGPLPPGSPARLHFLAFLAVRCGCVVGSSSFDVLCATSDLEQFRLLLFILKVFSSPRCLVCGIYSEGDPRK